MPLASMPLTTALLLAPSASAVPTPGFTESALRRFRFDPTALLSQSASPVADPIATPDIEPVTLDVFGQKGSLRWSVQGGGGADIDTSQDSLALVGGGISYFIADGLSFDVELNGLYVNQIGEDAGGINLALLFRWHFVNERNWSVYLDAGSGPLLTTSDVPDDGSSFNFATQAGLGLSVAVSPEARLMAGARWYHISNANIFSANPGRDSIIGYVGVSFPF